jgi:hypothetical protein
MRQILWAALGICFATSAALAQYGAPAKSQLAAAKPDFAITASYIEACSCDSFCPCYFNNHSTVHGTAHFCKFNNVLHVDHGYYKQVKLDGVKVWLSGDLGSEWSKGKAGWLVVTFDPAVSKAQQEAMTDILLQLYPMQWNIFGVDSQPIAWKVEGDTAEARMGHGQGEVILERFSANNQDPKKEVVIRNLKYWSAQSNTGFRIWKAKRNYYEGHGKTTDTAGTNGFLIRISFSGQAKKAAGD